MCGYDGWLIKSAHKEKAYKVQTNNHGSTGAQGNQVINASQELTFNSHLECGEPRHQSLHDDLVFETLIAVLFIVQPRMFSLKLSFFFYILINFSTHLLTK